MSLEAKKCRISWGKCQKYFYCEKRRKKHFLDDNLTENRIYMGGLNFKKAYYSTKMYILPELEQVLLFMWPFVVLLYALKTQGTESYSESNFLTHDFQTYTWAGSVSSTVVSWLKRRGAAIILTNTRRNTCSESWLP